MVELDGAAEAHKVAGKLPLQQTTQQDLSLIQTKWKSLIDPILINPLNDVSVLKNINLVTGSNVINHLLGKVQQGWFLIDKQASGDIYRTAPFNNFTLTLTSSANITVSIGVF